MYNDSVIWHHTVDHVIVFMSLATDLMAEKLIILYN